MNQLKKMFDPNRLIATIVFLVRKFLVDHRINLELFFTGINCANTCFSHCREFYFIETISFRISIELDQNICSCLSIRHYSILGSSKLQIYPKILLLSSLRFGIQSVTFHLHGMNFSESDRYSFVYFSQAITSCCKGLMDC